MLARKVPWIEILLLSLLLRLLRVAALH
uniref:Uncharacterized protein n=1 Tax=Rhizophora mucronata TaxID=61149 RepID=A0A2P2KT16_RHIMU